MKNVIIFIALLFVVACSSVTKIKAKNCVAIGNDLYECEELPNYNYNRR